ncbi:MAG: Trk system potassium uptake protein TrkA [Chlamydiales bacterium]|nr:Trk system potassium uptake protein TrkA [Chlamydiales bacterium]MCH9619551.1 Trk system potassium uptake protein TrkA [Chlamydiales bacterium]MCH9623157.1 Trk system potassium uptake protein TrkA [Chlamydiales bacterium]
MMNIVIIGASDIGTHLASLFSEQDHRVILIDKDPAKIEQIGRDLDIATRLGLGTDWELLEELLEFTPDLLIALTNDDEINLVSCTIAKNLGYPQTIARVRKKKYFMQSRLNFEQIFCVDHLIGPEKLTADAIASKILIPGSLAIENFAHGMVQMRTIKIPSTWKRQKFLLQDKERFEVPQKVMVGLIKRSIKHEMRGKIVSKKEQIIFPHGRDTLLADDEVTFIGETEVIRNLHKIFGIGTKMPKSVMIIGGSLVGIYLAQTLMEHQIRVMILEKNYEKCALLAELLPAATILQKDGCDYRFLQAEKVGEYDVVVCCTRDDEVNFLAGSIAKELGCDSVISSLSDTNYLPLVTSLGITQAISPRNCVANRILSIARQRSVTSMVSLYNNRAEIMEMKVSLDSKIAGIPIRLLGRELPNEMLIVAIQSHGRILIADGNRVLSPGDTVIVIANPKYVDEIKRLF